MHNFKNHSTQSTNPTFTMNYIDFLDARCDFDLSAFDEFMGYDCAGNSMRLDEYLFWFINSNKAAGLMHFDKIFDRSFTDLLETTEAQRLVLDLIMFSQRFPDALEFLRLDERHQPVFLITQPGEQK